MLLFSSYTLPPRPLSGQDHFPRSNVTLEQNDNGDICDALTPLRLRDLLYFVDSKFNLLPTKDTVLTLFSLD